jgi:hypothetical protein
MRIFLLKVALALAWAHQALAIYADDHWNYSTKLTEENFDSFVQGGIDAGKTVVRTRCQHEDHHRVAVLLYTLSSP